MKLKKHSNIINFQGPSGVISFSKKTPTGEDNLSQADINYFEKHGFKKLYY